MAVGAVTAYAGSGPYLASDEGAKRHPKAFVVHQPGVTYRFTSLRWTDWAKSRPEARGRLTACPNMAGCEKLGRAEVRLWRLGVGRCDGVRGQYYVRGTIILGDRTTPLDLAPSYVC